MQKVLELAEAKGFKAEVFSFREKSIRISKVNGVIRDIPASINSGVSVRIIGNGKIGTAFTMNLKDREALLENAILSMEAGVEADFSFPESGTSIFSEDYDPSIEEMRITDLNRQLKIMESHYREVRQGSIYSFAGCSTNDIRVINTSGADLLHRNSEVYGHVYVVNSLAGYVMKNSAIGVSDAEVFPSDVKRTVSFYNRSLSEVEVDGKRMKVLFTPDSLSTLTHRLSEASSAEAICREISPLLKRKNSLVISPLLSWVNDPTTKTSSRRLFDDEGVPTTRTVIFENGVFRNVYNNLDLACKMQSKPTGTSFRVGKKVTQAPSPFLSSVNFVPGEKSFNEMLAMMNTGVIVSGVSGISSGSNINGDLSVRLTGLYVKKGEVVGRLKNAMIVGNIYDILSKVIAVENKSHYTGAISKDPSILFDDIEIVTL